MAECQIVQTLIRLSFRSSFSWATCLLSVQQISLAYQLSSKMGFVPFKINPKILHPPNKAGLEFLDCFEMERKTSYNSRRTDYVISGQFGGETHL